MSRRSQQLLQDGGMTRRAFLAAAGIGLAGSAVGWPDRIHALSGSLMQADAEDARTGRIRGVVRVLQSRPTIEGAGVHLRRAFGHGEERAFDPFLMLDDFRNDDPEQYRSGFPWHPHRGIETITYVLAGTVEHQDSLGNRGSLGAGDVQWMTAGSGILHQEMPQGDTDGRMYGFQLWANLPSSLKMTAPRYQDIPSAEIPEVTDDDGTKARVICGTFWGKTGPVDGIAADPMVLDVSVPPGRHRSLPVPASRSAFAYVFAGSGAFRDASPSRAGGTDGDDSDDPAENRSLVQFDDGDRIVVSAGEQGIRFLLASGEALREPVAWRGPIVMNTDEELRQAYRELENGTFIRHADPRRLR